MQTMCIIQVCVCVCGWLISSEKDNINKIWRAKSVLINSPLLKAWCKPARHLCFRHMYSAQQPCMKPQNCPYYTSPDDGRQGVHTCVNCLFIMHAIACMGNWIVPSRTGIIYSKKLCGSSVQRYKRAWSNTLCFSFVFDPQDSMVYEMYC